MKVCYLNCVKILCKYGANPNCCSKSNLTPLHVLLSLMDMVQNARSPKDLNFVSSLTLTLLQHGANPNMVAGVGGSGKSANFGRPISDPRRPRDVYKSRQTNHQVLFYYCQTLINKD